MHVPILSGKNEFEIGFYLPGVKLERCYSNLDLLYKLPNFQRGLRVVEYYKEVIVSLLV